MTYLTCTILDGASLDHYREVEALIPPDHPAVPIARYAGVDRATLVIVEVWASKAEADRFGAEVLAPALEAHPPPDGASGRMLGIHVAHEAPAKAAVS